MAEFPIGYWVKRVRLAIRQHFDRALADHDLTAASYEALFHLATSGPCSSAALARMAGVTSQTMHRQVQMQLSSKLIRTVDGPGRAIQLELTPAGRRSFEAAQKAVMAIETQMLAGLSKREVADLGRLLAHCESQLNGRCTGTLRDG